MNQTPFFRALANPIFATVNISAEPRGHESYIRALVGPVIQSLCRILSMSNLLMPLLSIILAVALVFVSKNQGP